MNTKELKVFPDNPTIVITASNMPILKDIMEIQLVVLHTGGKMYSNNSREKPFSFYSKMNMGFYSVIIGIRTSLLKIRFHCKYVDEIHVLYKLVRFV